MNLTLASFFPTTFLNRLSFNPLPFFHSIDVVDTLLNGLNIESEGCKARAVCEVEAYVARKPAVFGLVAGAIGSRFSGWNRYHDARRFGREGHDCALVYGDVCQQSVTDSFALFRK